jgi:hypothetical protein
VRGFDIPQGEHLAVELVNCLAHGLSDTTGRIFSQGGSRICDALSCEIIVSGDPTNTFLQSAGKLAADSRYSLPCSPAERRPGSVLGVPRSSRVSTVRAGEHNVSSKAETGDGNHQWQHSHRKPQQLGCNKCDAINSNQGFFLEAD